MSDDGNTSTRMNEFALGATYHGGSGLVNAVTQTGNNVDQKVAAAVSS